MNRKSYSTRSRSREEVVESWTGGRKGVKEQRLDLVPWDVVLQDSVLLSRGARKYGERNWERGIPVSLSWAAMMRHAIAWWLGEEEDRETGMHHLLAVRFHAASILRSLRTSEKLDDRPRTESSGRSSDLTGRRG